MDLEEVKEGIILFILGPVCSAIFLRVVRIVHDSRANLKIVCFSLPSCLKCQAITSIGSVTAIIFKHFKYVNL
jgi:hypothetical protein